MSYCLFRVLIRTQDWRVTRYVEMAERKTIGRSAGRSHCGSQPTIGLSPSLSPGLVHMAKVLEDP